MTKSVVHVTTVSESLSFLRGQGRFLKEHGYDFSAVTSPSPDNERFAEAEGVTVHEVAISRAVTPAADLRALLELVQLLKRLQPDIVHAGTPKAAFLGLMAARMAGVKHRVFQLRGLRYETSRGLRRAMFKGLDHASVLFSEVVVVNSHSVLTAARKDHLFGLTPARVLGHGSSNGVDVASRFNIEMQEPQARQQARQRFGLSDDSFVIGFVGRIVRDKGIATLASVWERLRDEHPNLEMLVVGAEEPGDPVAPAALKLLRSDARVHMAGVVRDVENVYPAMDTLLLPTYREGTPNVLLEAGALGVPCIASRVTGCVDVIEDQLTGRLVENTPTAFVEALRQYLADPELLRKHGRAAAAHVRERFAQPVVWRDLIKLYDELTGEHT
ncbi:MAG: glycosyltransferase family 4 protein [Polyangiaceae bacterium]